MRILGYPAEKISIITTYNGQASLLRDVVQTRCAENPLIGVPHKVYYYLFPEYAVFQILFLCRGFFMLNFIKLLFYAFRNCVVSILYA